MTPKMNCDSDKLARPKCRALKVVIIYTRQQIEGQFNDD